ncbi:MAG: aminotransferase class I/II-fold pyridoxal phosphate-dependent enzyme, partial [Candidatus Dormibacteraeota bacterium]|nr:aminotransferase class I/II-fold pyridoxal phosphate-dependent enzyme [Candidatus Dormibacteraeota bacterium]
MKGEQASINSAAAGMPSSGIREIMYAALGRPDVIRLEVGEPDFPTPRHIVDAANSAAIDGHTGYVESAGIPQLREALATKVREHNGYGVAPDQVIVSQGGVQGIFATLLALTQTGDEVLLPDPAWPNFLMMVRLLNLHAVTYPLTGDSNFLPTIETLERLVTERTRLMVLNSPSNPLGVVIDRPHMRELLEFAESHGLWTLSDECYDQITFDDSFVSPASIAPEHVVSVYSFSKTYAMTGWRVGYVVAPPQVAPTLAKCQEPLLSCINTPAQFAALAAVTGAQEVVTGMRDAYCQRRDAALAVLDGTPLHALTPQGAFYLWVDVSSIGLPSRELALR